MNNKGGRAFKKALMNLVKKGVIERLWDEQKQSFVYQYKELDDLELQILDYLRKNPGYAYSIKEVAEVKNITRRNAKAKLEALCYRGKIGKYKKRFVTWYAAAEVVQV
jgi:DNA-binding MarR family transcriptional regulator